jgi:hypothetical protein
MKFYQETTEWADTTPNHVYLLNDSREKMYAYIAQGSDQVVEFKNPIRINSRGRKFIPVANRWRFKITLDRPNNPTWTVAGSKGNTYQVELVDGAYTCTCPGHKYRGNCRHVEEISGKADSKLLAK